MLRIEVDTPEIIAVKMYLARSGRANAVLASRIGVLHNVTVRAASSFNAAQADALRRKRANPTQGLGPIPDGRLATLKERVFGSWSDHSFPFGAAILHGIRLRSAENVPMGENSYLGEIWDGPGQQRRFGDLAMLALYYDVTKTLTFAWIGPAADIDGVKDRFRRAAAVNWGRLLSGTMTGWSNT